MSHESDLPELYPHEKEPLPDTVEQFDELEDFRALLNRSSMGDTETRRLGHDALRHLYDSRYADEAREASGEDPGKVAEDR